MSSRKRHRRARPPRSDSRQKNRGQSNQVPAARPPSGAELTIRYLDPHVVVVEKPAGLTTMRHAEEAAEFGARALHYLPPTLADLLPALLARKEPGRRTSVYAVHRLDKETSGLVLFARTKEAERNLGQQFRAHTI